MKSVKNVVITMGDPAGISGEIIASALTALARPRSALAKGIRVLLKRGNANVYVVGDATVLALAKRIVRSAIPVDVVDGFAPEPLPPTRIRLFERSTIDKRAFRFGVSLYGRQQLDYLKFAIEKARRGAVAAIVTAPMTKEAVAKVEPGFVGHTGYLAEELGVHDERMAFLTPDYLLALQTTHVPLVDVAKNLTPRGIATSIAMLSAAGRNYYGKDLPVAVLGLNPHAGEHGLLGLRRRSHHYSGDGNRARRGHACDGPFPADSFFIARVKRYKLILAMYHDQGLVAVKPALSAGFSQRHPRATRGAHVGRPRIGLRHRRQGQSRRDEHALRHQGSLGVDQSLAPAVCDKRRRRAELSSVKPERGRAWEPREPSSNTRAACAGEGWPFR
jgi:4-hydroxy-L-threonine phosphate dehydrogenase PdxA